MKNFMSIGLGLALALGSIGAVASENKKPAKKDQVEKKDEHKDAHHKDEKKPKKDH
jgi:hypothetical protein